MKEPGTDTIAKGAQKSYWLNGESKGKSCKKAMFISYSLQVYQTVYIHVQVVRVDQTASNHWRTGKILLGELNIP